MQWARACTGWFFRSPAVTDGETIVHELSSALQRAGHADAIKSALIDSVRRLTRRSLDPLGSRAIALPGCCRS